MPSNLFEDLRESEIDAKEVLNQAKLKSDFS